MVEVKFYYATGRRKESVAKVKLLEGKGEIGVNGMPVGQYFPHETQQILIRRPLEITNLIDKYKVIASVNGGGINGQAGALSHGIARALVKVDGDLKPILRKAGLIIRDPRKKERKKYGRKGARKRFQYSKR